MLHDIKKANKFLKAINKHAEEQRQKIHAESKNYKKLELEKAKEEILQNSISLIKTETEVICRSMAREVCKKEMQGRQRLFDKRASITQRVILKAEEQLKKFTQTHEYFEFLENYAKEISQIFHKSEQITLILRKEDLKFSDFLCKILANGGLVQSSEEIKIGGLKALDGKKGVLIDATLDQKLQNQRSWFIENCGMDLTIKSQKTEPDAVAVETSQPISKIQI